MYDSAYNVAPAAKSSLAFFPTAAILPSLARHCVVCRPARRSAAKLTDAYEALHGFTSRHFVTTVTAIAVITAIASSIG
jgi:hypothetical protein